LFQDHNNDDIIIVKGKKGNRTQQHKQQARVLVVGLLRGLSRVAAAVVDHIFNFSRNCCCVPRSVIFIIHINKIMSSTLEQAEKLIPAEVRMISGCKDEQTSADVSNVANFSLPDPAGKNMEGDGVHHCLLLVFDNVIVMLLLLLLTSSCLLLFLLLLLLDNIRSGRWSLHVGPTQGKEGLVHSCCLFRTLL